ncbi:MAG: dTDP-4-dehydrorhamnose 3,5-epimerase family protein [Armatimonadetes bacterium]|nr:dTDP-4-dehydrorhamnose 3,5-epimerase family protein [Armatimonadota bacterium]
MIDGVLIKPLKRNADERGFLMEMLRADDEEFFERYQQSYISLNYPGVIRAWHYHLKQKDIWVVPQGMVKAVLYDVREGSPTKGEVQEVHMGVNNMVMLKIPIGVYHGYKTTGLQPSLLINYPDQFYDPADEYRAPYDSPDIPYNWDIKMT